MRVDVADVIEDHGARAVRLHPQAAPDLLQKHAEGFGRPQQDRTRDNRNVHALANQIARCQNLKPTIPDGGYPVATLCAVHFPVYGGGTEPGGLELLRHMIGMSDRDAECDCRPAIEIFRIVLHRVAGDD